MSAVPKDRSSQLWSLATLAITYSTFPLVITYVALAAMWHRLIHGSTPSISAANKPKTVIVTGGKVCPPVPRPPAHGVPTIDRKSSRC